jgi:hypothetical protein
MMILMITETRRKRMSPSQDMNDMRVAEKITKVGHATRRKAEQRLEFTSD